MATYERQVRRTTRVEYVVPAGPPFGACWVEVYKAVAAIHVELREAGRIVEGADAPDDVIRIEPRDDDIVISYEDVVAWETP